MGYYINETPKGRTPRIGKADFLINNFGAIELHGDIEFQNNLVCVVENRGSFGSFDAAAYAYSQKEMDEFKEPDLRKKRWLIVPDADVLSGFKTQ